MKRVVGAAAVAGVAMFGGAGAFDDNTTRDASGEITEAGGLGVYAIQIGDCVMLPDAEQLTSMEAVPCSGPHDAQAFAKPDSEFGGVYEENAVFESGGLTCEKSFESFVGTDYYESRLEIYLLYPLAEGWDAGDRELVCMVTPAIGDPPLIGDAQNSGW